MSVSEKKQSGWIELFKESEAGNAVLETAFTFPFLMALLLGAVQLGVMAHGAIEATNAARAGAQYAAMNGGGYNDANGILSAAQSDAGELTITSATATSSCACSDGSGACTNTSGVYSCATGKTVITVTVLTKAGYPSLIRVPGLFSSNTFTLSGSAQQQVLQ